MAGLSYMDVFQISSSGGEKEKIQQLHAPKWSGTYQLSYTFPKAFVLDFTGTFSGPMRLPIQPLDYRPEYSPWFTLANIQLTKKFNSGIEIYGGCEESAKLCSQIFPDQGL
jgi:outer membrane receptor for ferrienterochelin and colicins